MKKLNKGPAKDYYNSFIDLAENSVIDMDLALKIVSSMELRNILVHEYQNIDNKIVYKSKENILKYYIQYTNIISEYLNYEQDT